MRIRTPPPLLLGVDDVVGHPRDRPSRFSHQAGATPGATPGATLGELLLAGDLLVPHEPDEFLVFVSGGDRLGELTL